MDTKLKNKILLIGSSFLLLLQSWQAVEAFYKFHFLLTWKIVLYVFVALFLCGLGYYIRLFYADDSHGLSEDKKEKKKIITFLEIALLLGIGAEFAGSLYVYEPLFPGIKTLLRLQIHYGILTYPFLLTCCLFFLLIPRKIGYIVCMILPFYLVYYFTRSKSWIFILYMFQTMWIVLAILIFMIAWCVLCHRRVMLEHWRITTRKELYCCLSISVAIGFLIYYFHL